MHDDLLFIYCYLRIKLIKKFANINIRNNKKFFFISKSKASLI